MKNFEQALVPSLVFLAIMLIGGAIVWARAARGRAIAPRLHSDSRGELPILGEEPAKSKSLLTKVGAAVSFGSTNTRLQQQLARAGFHATSAVQVFLGIKILLLAGGTVATVVLMVPMDLQPLLKVVAGFTVGAMISFIPNLVLSVRRQSRSAEVRRFLPDATDLLEICVSAGMGLDMAWNSVTDEIRRVSGMLADEMALTNLEIQLGAARPVAMRRMAERTGAPELTSLVAVLIQSERFGTSVADALRSFAGSMREERSQRAEEQAEKMSVKLLFPMVILIFPAALIVMVGPAAIRLAGLMAR